MMPMLKLETYQEDLCDFKNPSKARVFNNHFREPLWEVSNPFREPLKRSLLDFKDLIISKSSKGIIRTIF